MHSLNNINSAEHENNKLDLNYCKNYYNSNRYEHYIIIVKMKRNLLL